MTTAIPSNTAQVQTAAAATAAAAGAPPPPTNAPATTAPTAEANHEAAVKALTRMDHVEKLWKQCWTDASFFAKPFTVLKYFWYRSDAIEKDKATTEFNNATTELVKTVYKRYIRANEQANASNGEGTSLTGPFLDHSNDREIKTEEALSTFYKAFKTRLNHMRALGAPESDPVGITELNSVAFHTYAGALEMLLKNKAKELELTSPSLNTKIETTADDFYKKMMLEQCMQFADKSLDQITKKSFQEQAANLKAQFSNAEMEEIETYLRQAILNKHGVSTLKDLAAAYRSAEASNPYIIAFYNEALEELHKQQQTLRKEVSDLRGTDHFNGEIHTLDTAAKRLKADLSATMTALKTALGITDEIDGEALLNAAAACLGEIRGAAPAGNTDVLRNAKNAFAPKWTAYIEAQKSLDEKNARLGEIATFNGSPQIAGGTLFTVNEKLRNTAALDLALTGEATAKAQKIADFYDELGESNLQNTAAVTTLRTVRHNALQAILNSN